MNLQLSLFIRNLTGKQVFQPVVSGVKGDDRLQSGRPHRRQLESVEAAPGLAEDADAPVAPGLAGQPVCRKYDLFKNILFALNHLHQEHKSLFPPTPPPGRNEASRVGSPMINLNHG